MQLKLMQQVATSKIP